MSAAVLVRGLTVEFRSRRVRALGDVDLTIDEGEHVALLGPSGAGKTTLLRSLLGAVEPVRGTVRVLGRDPCGSKPDRRAVRTRTGLVRQGGDLVLSLSARANALSGTSASWSPADWWRVLRGRVPQHLSERLHELARQHGVLDCLDAPGGQLSGGQRQRVALLRALLPAPDLLLADEPTAGLDPAAAARAVAAIRGSEAGTVIVSTHDAAVAGAFPRIIALRDGHLVHDGPLLDTAAIYGESP